LTVGQNPPAVARVFPDPDSFTGWSATAMLLPPDIGPGGTPGPSRLPPRAVIAPDRNLLIVYRQYSVQTAALVAEGGFQAFAGTPTRMCMPMVLGELPAGSQYIPEMLLADISGIASGMAMRNLAAPHQSIPVDSPASAFPFTTPFAPPRVFPLKATRSGVYRCVVVARDGTLAAWSKDWNEKAATVPDPRGPVVRP
jgi:hypothetical protein